MASSNEFYKKLFHDLTNFMAPTRLDFIRTRGVERESQDNLSVDCLCLETNCGLGPGTAFSLIISLVWRSTSFWAQAKGPSLYYVTIFLAFLDPTFQSYISHIIISKKVLVWLGAVHKLCRLCRGGGKKSPILLSKKTTMWG